MVSAWLCTMDTMGETRQQRRARERAAAKAARGPGANFPPLEIVVELFRYADEDDDGPYAWWVAQWAPRDSGVGTEDSNEVLEELVASVLEDCRSWMTRYDVRLEWVVDGDAPGGRTMAEAVREAGVTLPDRIPSLT